MTKTSIPAVATRTVHLRESGQYLIITPPVSELADVFFTARHQLRSWVMAYAPAVTNSDVDGVLSIAAEYGFREFKRNAVIDAWEPAWERWKRCRVRASRRSLLAEVRNGRQCLLGRSARRVCLCSLCRAGTWSRGTCTTPPRRGVSLGSSDLRIDQVSDCFFVVMMSSTS